MKNDFTDARQVVQELGDAIRHIIDCDDLVIKCGYSMEHQKNVFGFHSTTLGACWQVTLDDKDQLDSEAIVKVGQAFLKRFKTEFPDRYKDEE
jgi:hypothetical protein